VRQNMSPGRRSIKCPRARRCMRSVGFPILLVALLFLPAQTVAQANQGPSIETADPAPGPYSMASPGSFAVEVECSSDPDGDDVFVEFIANGQVVEVDEDLWGWSPSYTFDLAQSGMQTLQARCRDDSGASGSPGSVTWSVQVAGQASGSSQSPQGQGGVTSAFDQVTPAPGPYLLAGADRFPVEVDCPGNDEAQVDFVIDDRVVKTETDGWGWSPSYTFFVFQSGTHVLAARCTTQTGRLSAEWALTVARPSQSATLLAPTDGCMALADPDAFPTAPGDLGKVRALLMSNEGVWHRTGPWTCDLAALAEPVALAYDLDSMLVGVKLELDSWALVDYSVWDFVVGVVPQVEPVWAFLENLLPILQTCSTALRGLDAFEEVRSAAVLFLAEPATAQLEALRAVILQALPAYQDWISAFELAAHKVAELADYLRSIADEFLLAADESEIAVVQEVLAYIGDTIRGLGAVVDEYAASIDALADPIRGDVGVMETILQPSGETGAPGLPLTWLLALVFAALVVLRRQR
jgi:hypothetical protein